jgi:hypothetical protein
MAPDGARLGGCKPLHPKHRNNITMTNMKLTKSNLIGALTLGVLALAPNTQYAAGSSYSSPAESIPFSVGAEAGTTGLGGNVGWRFMDYLGVQSGFDYFSYTYNGKIKDDNYNAKLRLMSEPLNLEVFPWKRSSFHISLGALFNQMSLNGAANGKITLNGDSYSGTLNLNYKPQAVAPYLGIGGNLYFDKAHHWSLMGALGVAWDGDGSVSLTGTAPAAVQATFNSDLAKEQSKIRSYAKDLQFWPVLKIGVTYSF